MRILEKSGETSVQLDFIREFIAVATLRSFTAASRKLFVSQSTLKRHISTLEKDLGVQLLVCSTHSVDLTPMGVESLERLSAMLQDYDQLRTQAARANRQLNARLRLGVFPMVVDEYALSPTKMLRKNYPNIALECEPGMPSELKLRLLSDDLDLIMAVSTDFPSAVQMRFCVSGQERYVAMLDAGHPLAGRPSLQLSDLAEECILLHRDEDYAGCAVAAMAASGFVPRHTATIAGIETLPITLLETNGIFISASSLQKMAFSGVSTLPFDDPCMALTVYFAYKASNPNPALPLFLKTSPATGCQTGAGFTG